MRYFRSIAFLIDISYELHLSGGNPQLSVVLNKNKKADCYPESVTHDSFLKKIYSSARDYHFGKNAGLLKIVFLWNRWS